MTVSDCQDCEDALELDQIALVKLGNAEIGVIACEWHLRRITLAIETVEAVENATHAQIPPLVKEVHEARLSAWPRDRSS
ncbi:MAG TPA: hypothetical protein VGG25_31255 [Streptosporangiaceae bacterium]